MCAQQLLIDFDNLDAQMGVGVVTKMVEQPKEKKYKYKIDKKLLKECLVDFEGTSPNRILYVQELNKLIGVIFNKHFSKYAYMQEDLSGEAIAAVYSKREYYEPSRDAYNFMYAVIRNEIGNKILKYTKENLIEDYTCYSNMNTGNKVEYYDDIPKMAAKYFDNLVGDVDMNYTVVEKRDVADLALYLKLNERKSRIHDAPEYVEVSQHTINVMYNLLKLAI